MQYVFLQLSEETQARAQEAADAEEIKAFAARDPFASTGPND